MCGPGQHLQLRVAYAPTLFHEQGGMQAGRGACREDLDSLERPPHLVVCFNAGVW